MPRLRPTQYTQARQVETYVRDFITVGPRDYCVAVWRCETYWEVVVWDLGLTQPGKPQTLGMPRRRVGPFAEKSDALDLMAESLALLFMGADPVEVVVEAADALDLFGLDSAFDLDTASAT